MHTAVIVHSGGFLRYQDDAAANGCCSLQQRQWYLSRSPTCGLGTVAPAGEQGWKTSSNPSTSIEPVVTAEPAQLLLTCPQPATGGSSSADEPNPNRRCSYCQTRGRHHTIGLGVSAQHSHYGSVCTQQHPQNMARLLVVSAQLNRHVTMEKTKTM